MGINFGEIYESQHGIVVNQLDEHFLSILNKMDWKPNEIILDHGCGIGRTCLTYIVPKIQNGTMIYGIDISKSMIKCAQEKYSHPNVKYFQTDLMSNEFEFKDFKFDKIFSNFVFHLIDEPQREILKRMYDLLVPGGYLVTCEVPDAFHIPLRLHLKKHQIWKEHSKHLVIATDNGYSSYASYKEFAQSIREEVGFEVILNNSEQVKYKFEDLEASADFLLAHDPAPHEKYLTPKEQENLRQEILAYLKNVAAKDANENQAEGEYQVQYGMQFVIARKPLL